jgi:glycosyltransferase involved in cell wall biosynthesis
MKILFVIDSLRFGGTERQLVELIKGFSTRSDLNFRMTVVCLKPDGNSYAHEIETLGVPIYYFPRKFKLDVAPIFLIWRLITKKHIDLIHSYNNLGALFGGIAAKLSNTPLVCSAIRDAKDWNLFSKISKRFLSHISDAFISNSISGFNNRFKTIQPHFHVIYNGMDMQRFAKDSRQTASLKSDLNLLSFSHCVGMVAALSKRKDHETFCYAAAEVLKRIPDVCFLVIGDGEKRSEIENLVRELGVSSNFRFLGYRKDCDQLTSVLDVSVLLTNTEYHFEGVSNAIIEAMASGVPVIATRGGGTDEIIEDHVNGFLVNPRHSRQVSEKILRLINDHSQYAELSENAYQTINQRCSISHYIDSHETIYLKLLRTGVQ